MTTNINQHFDVLLEHDAEHGAWVSYVPALNNLSTYGGTREEAIAATREAIEGYLYFAARRGFVIPPLPQVHPEPGQEVIQLQVEPVPA